MGQIKNIKLHIVTDIKEISHNNGRFRFSWRKRRRSRRWPRRFWSRRKRSRSWTWKGKRKRTWTNRKQGMGSSYQARKIGQGFENHAGAETNQGRTENQIQGIRCYWRLWRPCWFLCEMCKGSGNSNQRSHHPSQVIHHSSSSWLLGKQVGKTSHSTSQGDRKMWFSISTIDSSSSRYKYRSCWCFQEASADGRNRRLLHFS